MTSTQEIQPLYDYNAIISSKPEPMNADKLKICFVTNEYPTNKTYGAGVYAWNFTKSLAELGHDISVLTWGLSDVAEVKNLHVHRVKLLSGKTRLPVLFYKLIFFLTLPLMILKVNKSLKGIDALHINAQFFSALASILILKFMFPFLRIPKVVTVHHLEHHELQLDKSYPFKKKYSFNITRRLSRQVERLVINTASAIVTVSEFTKKALHEIYGVQVEKIHVIPNGISTTNRATRKLDLQKKRGDVFLLSVGRMEPRKGIHLLLKAFKDLSVEYPNVKLVLVGEGTSVIHSSPSFADLKDDGVRTYEYIDDESLNSMYNFCDIYVSPSLLEGFGLTILEAMSAGKPIIAAKNGGVSDFVEDGRNGLLVEPNNWQALRDAIAYLVEDHSLRREMGDVNKEYVHTGFRWERSAEKAVAVFRKLADSVQNGAQSPRLETYQKSNIVIELEKPEEQKAKTRKHLGDIISLHALIATSLAARVLLMNSVGSIMYYFDSYSYYSSALRFVQFGVFPTSRIAYTGALAGWLSLFTPSGFDLLLVGRVFGILVSILAIIVVYFVARTILPALFAFMLSLMVSLEPRFLAFSITTHNDAFFILTGFLSLYLSFKKSKLVSMVLAPILLAVSSLTSEWMYVLFGPLLLMVYLSRLANWTTKRNHKIMASTIIVSCYLLPFFLPQAWKIYYSGTRFNPIERIQLFLKPELLVYVWNQVFNITSNQFVNYAIMGLSVAGFGLLCFEIIIPHLSFLRISDKKPSPSARMMLFSIVYLFFMSIFIFTVFSLSYTLVNGVPSVIRELNFRYVIFPRILLVMASTYFLWRIWKTLCSLKFPRISLIKLTTIVLTILTASSFLYTSAEAGASFTQNSSDVLLDFKGASSWLRDNMRADEVAIVPFIDVFTSYLPSLSSNFIDYAEIWLASGVVFAADTTVNDAIKVRQFLITYLQKNPRITYFVVDKLYPQCNVLFNESINDSFESLLFKEVAFPFKSGFTDPITIYKVVWPKEVLTYDFARINENWRMLTRGNVSYLDKRGFWLTSNQNDSGVWFDLNSILTSETLIGVNLTLASETKNNMSILLYCDVNGDGEWSGYELDKTASINLKIPNDLSVQTFFKTVIKPPYPVVRIGFILSHTNDSSDKSLLFSSFSLSIYSNADALFNFRDASAWLRDNLKASEIAVVPLADIFVSYQPSLNSSLLDFSQIWSSSSITYSTNVTSNDILSLRNHLYNYLRKTPQVKYVFRDDLYSQCYILFNSSINDLLSSILIKATDFPTAGLGAVNPLYVYRVIWPQEIFSFGFSTKRDDWSLLTRGNVTYLDGLGFRLSSGLNDSALWFNFDSILRGETVVGVALSLSSNGRNVLLVVLYCDLNGDGQWSGYELDNAVTVKTTIERNNFGTENIYLLITKLPSPIIRIGFILTPASDSLMTRSVILHGFTLNIYST